MAKRSRSVLKRIRQNRKRRERNRVQKIRLKKMLKELKKIENPEEYQKKLPIVQSAIDKAVKRHLLHKNTAARIKSKLMKTKQLVS
ncbi:MAG: 30S ribosomal protein S20 [candidate division WOR-3 bacterium]